MMSEILILWPVLIWSLHPIALDLPPKRCLRVSYLVLYIILNEEKNKCKNIVFRSNDWKCESIVPAIGIIVIDSKALAHSSINTCEKCCAEMPALVKVPAVHNVHTKTRNLHRNANDG